MASFYTDAVGGDGKTTFHVVPCSLDFLRSARGRCVDANQQEVCQGFARKKYVPIERDPGGGLVNTLPGGRAPDEVIELDRNGQGIIEKDMLRCMHCGRGSNQHKMLRTDVKDAQGMERFRCKNCSYCDTFCRVGVPDNNRCEDCGCDASKHQSSYNDPIPRPPAAPRHAGRGKGAAAPVGGAAEDFADDLMGRIAAADLDQAPARGGGGGAAGVESGTVADLLGQLLRGADEPAPPNAHFKPGEQYEVIGSIMREGESLDSPKISKLRSGLLVEVLEVGAGPTGKRIRVATETGLRGWISVVSDEGKPLVRRVHAPPASAEAPGAPPGPAGKTADCEPARPDLAEEPPVESLADLLGRLGMEEEPAEAGPPPAAGAPEGEEAEEPSVESLADILSKLGMEEEAEREKEQGTAVPGEDGSGAAPEAPRGVPAGAGKPEERSTAVPEASHGTSVRSDAPAAGTGEEAAHHRASRRGRFSQLTSSSPGGAKEAAKAAAQTVPAEAIATPARAKAVPAPAARGPPSDAKQKLPTVTEEGEAEDAEPPAPMPGGGDAAWRTLDEAEESPLACAARRRDLFQVQALLRDRANVNERNSVGETPLLEVAASGDLNVVALLLGWKADPAERMPGGVTEEADNALVPEVRLLFTIFRERKVDTEAKRSLLTSLDPGAQAQVRNRLFLGQKALPFLQNTLEPAACLGAGPVREEKEAADHSVRLYLADRVRPVLLLSPLWKPCTATVILLHGLFQSGRMCERLARDLVRNLPHVQVIAPTARSQECMWGVGPAWAGEKESRHVEHLEAAHGEILDVLRRGPAAATQPGRVVLAGFSQGGWVASYSALRMQERIAGLLLFGTGGSHIPQGPSGLSVLQCHGKADMMVPEAVARLNAKQLREVGCSVQLSLHDGVGHNISGAMVAEARDWLQWMLPDPSGGADNAAAPASAQRAPDATPTVIHIGGDEEDGEEMQPDDAQVAHDAGPGADHTSDGWDAGVLRPDVTQVAQDMPNVIHIGGDEDDEADKAGDGGADLDAMFDFGEASRCATPIGRPGAAPTEAAVDPPADESPLAAAARRGDVDQVKQLLRQRADPDVRGAGGTTPLFGAVQGSHTDVVAVLLLARADPAARSDGGAVAADLALGPPSGALLRLALGAPVRAEDQRAAFAVLEECTRWLVARFLQMHDIRTAVEDVLSEAQWDAVCAA